MAGIYIHIPFCVQACHYCDFHFSTNRKNQAVLVESICKELELQINYLPSTEISTLYFGGGTPSVLEDDEIDKIFETIHKHYKLQRDAEITVEVNPDDMRIEKLVALKKQGVNRLSVGIQTFDDAQLTYLNRAHNASQALLAVQESKALGYTNISIDLIYGIPALNHTIWEKDLTTALQLGVQHISSYCLTIEPKTVFGRRLERKELAPENEEYNALQFERLLVKMEENQFEHYEVSNFALPGFISKHNSNYWHNEPYIGIGPGAHSYDGKSRQYNIANNTQYIQALLQGKIPSTVEYLDNKTLANEYIMTKLRTKWGVDYSVIENNYNLSTEEFKKIVEKHEKLGNLKCTDSLVVLTKKGLFIADKITADLFYI